MFMKMLIRFARNKNGNFAMLTALLVPALIASIALALDVSNTMRLRTNLQNANDAAVLFATRNYQITKVIPTTSEVQAFIKNNLRNETISNIKISFDTNSRVMTLTSEASVPAMFSGFFGSGMPNVAVLSKATVGVSGLLEFALALDTTQSMEEEGRIDGLKAAAASFVNTMMDAKDRGAKVRGAIVPFERYVNVGLANRNASWMSIPKEYDNRTYKQACKKNQTSCNKTERQCKDARTINHPATAGSCWYDDGVKKCSQGSPAWVERIAASCKNVCTQPVYGPDKCNSQQTGGDNWVWKGCVLSRTNGWNVKDEFSGQVFTGILDGMSWKSCATELLPLTDSRQTILSAVNALTPSGDTYLPEGVMWGTRVLTTSQPFTEASDFVNGLETRKAMIIMTDGKNSLQTNQWGWHDGLPDMEITSVPDAVTLAACNEAKAKNIEVYTVSFGSAITSGIKALMESCASKPQFSSYAADNADLLKSFQEISENLFDVRLTQ